MPVGGFSLEAGGVLCENCAGVGRPAARRTGTLVHGDGALGPAARGAASRATHARAGRSRGHGHARAPRSRDPQPSRVMPGADRPLRVAVVAEYYPRPVAPGLGHLGAPAGARGARSRRRAEGACARPAAAVAARVALARPRRRRPDRAAAARVDRRRPRAAASDAARRHRPEVRALSLTTAADQLRELGPLGGATAGQGAVAALARMALRPDPRPLRDPGRRRRRTLDRGQRAGPADGRLGARRRPLVRRRPQPARARSRHRGAARRERRRAQQRADACRDRAAHRAARARERDPPGRRHPGDAARAAPRSRRW